MNKNAIKKYLIRYRWFRSLPMKIDITLNCIVYRDETAQEWVARCLDLNLAVANERKMGAVEKLNDLIAAQIRFTADNDNWASLFSSAGKKEWTRFEQMKKQCRHERTQIDVSNIRSTVDMCFA